MYNFSPKSYWILRPKQSKVSQGKFQLKETKNGKKREKKY